MKLCYIILTHKTTKELTEYIGRIKSELNIDIFIVNPECYTSDNKFNTKYSEYIGNSIFPIIAFKYHHNYDRYIVHEWDTRFTGNHEKLIEIIEKSNSDLLLQEVPESCNDWIWDKYTDIPENNKIHCLLQWYCISKRALKYIEMKYQEKWYGHYECIVPTAILNNSEFKVDYLNNYINVITDWDVNTFKNKLYKHLCENKSLDDCLLHPIKT